MVKPGGQSIQSVLHTQKPACVGLGPLADSRIQQT
jgi:hypothetical protein